MIKGSKEKSFFKELQETRDSRNCIDFTMSIKVQGVVCFERMGKEGREWVSWIGCLSSDNHSRNCVQSVF